MGTIPDVLSSELTLQGQRAIVDTGVSSYERGPERHYERSTAAYNTIRVDGLEQAEIWGGFRVGRRPAIIRFVAARLQAVNSYVARTSAMKI